MAYNSHALPLTRTLRKQCLSAHDFQAFRQYLYGQCGIDLKENKIHMVQSRLMAILPETGVADLGELVQKLINHSLPDKTKTRIVDALTTNETYWFRDPRQFEVLDQVILPEFNRNRFAPRKVWSAACSSGQEPFSISIAVEEFARSQGMAKPNLQIVGTDLSSSILEKAKSAVFSDLSLSRGLPESLKQRYFYPYHGHWQLHSDIVKRVSFRQLNLLKSFTSLGKFDLIFCRNVLIYFSSEVKRDILQRLVESLKPGGYLFLSSTERLPEPIESLQTLRSCGVNYYRRSTSSSISKR